MLISSRTPEGLPSRCPLCGAETNLEVSEPTGDAPCPSCGHLRWYSATALAKIQRHMADILGVAPERITAETRFTGELCADSIDTVELVMQLEEEFDLEIPDDAAERILSVGDLIRYLERKHREEHG